MPAEQEIHKKLRRKIFETLPGTSKDIQKVEEAGKEADVYFVGFWNDKGTCSGSIMDYLSDLHGRKVALFGTCGMGGSREYFDQVAHRVEALIPDDNEYLWRLSYAVGKCRDRCWNVIK